jgi:hypothetical protein
VYVLWNSWIQLSLQNESVLNESLSMNVFRIRGIAFYTWQIGIRHRQRKWCQDLLRGELSRRNFSTGDMLTLSTMLGILISMLTYIYSICANLLACSIASCFFFIKILTFLLKIAEIHIEVEMRHLTSKSIFKFKNHS